MRNTVTTFSDFVQAGGIWWPKTVELVEGNSKSAIAVVHAFVENQGDAWTVTSAYLDRFVEEQRLRDREVALRRHDPEPGAAPHDPRV